ncbi:hypothetical protein, partial [Aurantimonas sp. VKM B-3413]|uniref:hypothetical protein n=1 Tax=Aurantimonas sp. VKM B-3413 TaxID=2779401 RepID=UPI001E3A0ECA
MRSDFLRQAEVAVLCDCDTFFVSDPRPYLPRSVVAAAVVDLPNPPSDLWDSILEQAGLARQRPDIPTGTRQGTTIFENRNGGLYVLPGEWLPQLDESWRKWAEWGLKQESILGKYVFHIDQITFALACLELRIQPELLPKALNFPIHLPPEDVGDDAPIMLHYHRQVDEYGKLRPLGQPTVDRAIAFANETLARPARLHRKRRLVLHVGLPKTGTSALQLWCSSHSEELLKQGIRYPTPSSQTQMPKHQFMVTDLQTGDLTRTCQRPFENGFCLDLIYDSHS